jgi:hypothetical protein
MKPLFLFGTILALFLSLTPIASSNGGNIRLAEGKYLVNISSSPVTPVAGEKTAMLISFADIATNKPLSQPLRASIEIRKKVNQEVVFPSTEYPVEGGILEFSFTYPEPQLYELFVRFEKSDEPGKIYEPEDFLVDVQAPQTSGGNRSAPMGMFVPLAFLLGIALGALMKRR